MDAYDFRDIPTAEEIDSNAVAPVAVSLGVRTGILGPLYRGLPDSASPRNAVPCRRSLAAG